MQTSIVFSTAAPYILLAIYIVFLTRYRVTLSLMENDNHIQVCNNRS